MKKFNSYYPSQAYRLMKKNWFLPFTFILTYSLVMHAQAPEATWGHSYGAKADDIARTAVPTPDGGSLVAGFTDSNCGQVVGNHGGRDAWVVKLDSYGDIVWAKCIGTNGNEEVYSMKQTTSGNYILAGKKSGNGGDAWVFEMNGNGEVLWESTYGGANQDAAHSIALTADGGYIVAGIYNEMANLGDGWVFKIDGSGTLLWEQTFDGPKQNSLDAIQAVSDGGFVAAGIRDAHVNFSAGAFWVIKLDESGNLLWEKTFGDTLNSNLTHWAHAIMETSDGDILAAGETEASIIGFDGHPYIVKLDQQGNTQWQTTLQDETLMGAVYSLHENSEAGYMLAGTSQLMASLIQLDNYGNFKWSKDFQAYWTMKALSLTATADNNYLLAGYYYTDEGANYCNMGMSNFFVLKLGSVGIRYVDKDATGANNGTSWADAYTYLHDAIATAQPGNQIWVAEGTYLPGTSSNSIFLIDKDIEIYGGFAGTESELEQRDWTTHPTILSGDVNGDDLTDNFTANRTDNINNIIRLTANVTNDMVLNGFIIEHGHADNITPGGLRGGGLWSAGSPTIRNCTFRQNYAEELGAGAYFGELTSGIIMEDCMFEANIVKESPSGFGGAMFVLNAITNQRIERCIFQNNFTGGLGLVGIDAEVLNCDFKGNDNPGFGAGLLVSIIGHDGKVQVRDCQFTGNISGQIGAGILGQCLEANNCLEVFDCTFEANRANGLSIGGGMAAVAVGENDIIEILRCDFKGNLADEGGGLLVQATFAGQPAPGAINLNVSIEQCTFEENQASDLNPNIITGGGGICGLNIPGPLKARVSIESCQFTSSTSENLGGGLTIYDETGNASYSVSNSLFSENTALNAGGITFINTGQEMSKLNIRSSILEGNGSAMTGGLSVWNDRLANSPKDSIFIENSLIADNLGGTIAGGISVQAEAEVFIFESTIANNENTGLKLQNKGKARLRNTILHNPGHDNYSSTGIINAISSLGGNLSGDQTLNTFFGATDKTNTDPLFSGTGDHPYQLSSSSPAIDAAVPVSNVPSFDLAGNARVQGTKMDMGAYESPFLTALKDRAATRQDLAVWPNPVSESCVVKLENNWRGAVEIRIVDEKGRTVRNLKTEKTARSLEVRIEAAELGTGEYFVILGNGLEMAVCKFIKI